ncbi:3-methylitaconate isomerase [Jeotgalicoccus nanhaiensis]|uniref:3-methylitaconate isomerase n=1 Tax=Jeotgalicoccus nanhaiensis TaxID=568603 RepID=A0ABR9XYV4_9STAP|nr:PrpF domain-containing protein [Jeotgalicoccus nanhaiensis]MBF0753758.1 3-methylitaconate isomerase [Jeotgalicoccus nanhaiensis]TFU61921.1 3-methylitaconate isomerase [Jeotgalicoccus nanhaiensis]
MHEFEKIRSSIIRGGTSKGVYIMKKELPNDETVRDEVISSIFGGADERQIDGLGGANSLTSKVAIVSVSNRDDADIDYTFGQVDITTGRIDYNSNCGNILSGIGPYAIDEGLVSVTEPVTSVRIYNTNTNKISIAEVPVQYGRAKSDGNYSIDGVPGRGAKIVLDFLDAAGSKTNSLFPTGNRTDTFEIPGYKTVEVSIIDITAPVVFVKASSIGLKGTELSSELTEEQSDLLETIRGMAAERIGFVEHYSEAKYTTPSTPKAIIVSDAETYITESGTKIEDSSINLTSRAMSMQKMHKAFPVTGGLCTAAASQLKGTVVYNCSQDTANIKEVVIGHPSGTMEFVIDIEDDGTNVIFNKTAVARTSRRLMEGYVYVPKELFWNIRDKVI